MEDIKLIIAKNITALRQGAKMTQIELAERLNYSDKAVSKWERAESIPDVTVLKTIADMFEVPLDYLVTENHSIPEPPVEQEPEFVPNKRRNHKVVTALSILLVWFVATTVYVILDAALNTKLHYLAFAYAVPVSMIVWLVMNSIWFSHRMNFSIISLLMWTTIGCVVLTLFLLGIRYWQLVLLGVLGQIIIITWSKFQYRKPNKE